MGKLPQVKNHCSKEFCSKSGLQAHIVSAHEDFKPENSSEFNEISNENNYLFTTVEENEKKLSKCNVCGKVFDNISSFYR